MNNKYIEYFKKNGSNIATVIMAILLLGYVAYNLDLKPSTELTPKVLKIKEVAKSEQCSPQEAKLILSDSLIAKSMNLFVADLNSYEVVETKSVMGYFTKEKLIGVNRSLVPKTKGSMQSYITIYEPIDKLNYNKKTYENLGSNFKKVAD